MIGFEPVSLAPFAPLAAPAQVQPFDFAFGRGDDRKSIAERLASTLDKIFRQLHRHAGHRARAVDAASRSLSPLVDRAVEVAAGSFRLQVASLTVDSGGQIAMHSLVLEAQMFRIEAATPEATAVIDFSGARISLSATEIAAGEGVHSYTQSLELAGFGLSAEAGAATLEARQAIATLTQTRLALEAYRGGDAGPLQRLIDDA